MTHHTDILGRPPVLKEQDIGSIEMPDQSTDWMGKKFLYVPYVKYEGRDEKTQGRGASEFRRMKRVEGLRRHDLTVAQIAEELDITEREVRGDLIKLGVSA